MENSSSIGSRIAILGRLYAKGLNERIVSTGLTGSQWAIIRCLINEEGLTQSSICEKLSVEAPTISKTLVTMETAGWVKRVADQADKREKRVILTKQAAAHIDAWQKIAEELNLTALDGLSGEEVAALDHILNHIYSNLHSHTTNKESL